MPETDELYNKMLNIERMIENIDAKMSIIVASDPKIRERTTDFFERRKDTLIPAYLAVDGRRNVSEIAQLLNKKQPNVTNYLIEIFRHGYIDKVDEGNGGVIYKKNELEKILHLSKLLTEMIKP
jgi:DNA-binding transcriptional ArsR family regulator